MNNNDIYNNYNGSSLGSALNKLNEANQIRNQAIQEQQTQQQVQQEKQNSNENWFTRLYATGLQAYKNIQRGLTETFIEAPIDFLLEAVGIFSPEAAEKAISFSITDTLMSLGKSSEERIYEKITGNSLEDQTLLNDASQKVQDIVINIEKGIGGALGFAGLNIGGAAIGGTTKIGQMAASYGLMAASASGSSMESAITDPNYDGNYLGAVGYSTASGLVEAGLELALGNVPNIGKLSSQKVLTSIAKDFVEEGFEEVLSDVAQPFLKTMYNNKSLEENLDELTLQGLAKTFLVGGTVGGLISGTVNIGQTIAMSPEGKKIRSELEYYKEEDKKAKEQYYKDVNKIGEVEARKIYENKRAEIASNVEALGERASNLAAKYQESSGYDVVVNGEKIKIPLTKEYISAEANEIRQSSPMQDAIRETIEFINDSTMSDYNIEFMTPSEMKEQGYNPNANGFIKSDNKSIVLSTNPIDAAQFVLAHELKHSLEEIPEMKNVETEIINSMDSDEYTKKYQEYSKRYNTTDKKTIHSEIVADKIGELAKNYKDVKKLFTKRSTLQKFIDFVINKRKSTKNSKAREMLARIIENARNINIATKENSKKSDTKYSIGKDIDIELENKNADSYIEAKKEFGTTTRLDYAGWLNVDGTMLDFSDGQGYRVLDHREIQNIYKDNQWTDALIQYLAEGNIRLQSYGFEVWKKPTKEQVVVLKRHIRNNYGEVVVDIDYNKNGDVKSFEYERGTPTDKIIEDINNYFDKGIEPVIDSSDDIRYSIGEKIENPTALEIANTSKQIQKQITKAQEFVKDNKQYQEDTIKAIKQLVDNNIKNINHTKRGSKDINKDARTVLTNLRGDKFLQNKFILETINPEQKAYLETALSFFEERIETLNYKSRKTIPALDYATNINDMEGYDDYADVFEGKTEGDVVLSTLRVISKVLNSASNEEVELNGNGVNRKEVTQDEVDQQIKAGRSEPKAQKGLLKSINQLATSVVDGDAMFDIWGRYNENSLMKKMYAELYQSHLDYLKVKREYQEDVDKFIKNNKKFVRKLKDKNQKVKIAGHDVYYGEAISLYMALEADNAPEHLLKSDRSGAKLTGNKGRIDIEQKDFLNMLTDEQRKDLKNEDIKGKERKDLYRKCGDTIRTEIGKVIGQDAQELISILRKHYSESGKLYQEIAEKYNGFSYILQKIYYPLKSDIASFNKQSGTIDTTGNFMNDTMNPSFTKALSSNVSNKLQISDVLDTYQHFSEQLATWTQISVKIKQLDRFLNTTVNLPNKQSGLKFREFLKEYVDPDFEKRYESLVLAMQQINKTEKTAVDRILNKIRGINATVSLAFNLKTIAIQPTAYFKYWLYVSPQNWLKALAPNKNLISFKELEKLSPLVYDRYYGNEGRNIAEAQTVGAARALNKLGQVGMDLISKTDKIPLKLGWKAIQLEAQSKGITDVNEIVKMFEEATYKTQATYDALSNGSAVRINNEISKSIFMFSAENRKTLSRFFHSIYGLSVDVKSKKAWKEFAGSTTSMIASAAVVAAITQFLRGLKGDNEEEEVMEGYLKEFTTNMVGVFPIISNLYNSLVNGYDLQLTGFSQITDLLDLPQYCETLMSTSATDDDKKHAIIQISQRLAHAIGIPFRNIYNDIMYIAGATDTAFKTNIVMELRNLYYNTNQSTMSTLMKTYAKRGDENKLKAMVGARFEKFVAGEISEDASKEIARLYMGGHITTMPSSINGEMTYNGQTYTLTKAQMTNAKDVYSLANDLLSDMIGSSDYANLTDEEKAKAIKKLYSTYYELAKSSVIDNYETSKLTQIANYFDISTYVVALSKISNIEQTEKLSRKTAVMQYINKLKLNKNQKYLLLLLAGYSVSEENVESLLKYLKTNGMSSKEADNFLGIKK